jgi:hypothetical protein
MRHLGKTKCLSLTCFYAPVKIVTRLNLMAMALLSTMVDVNIDMDGIWSI